MNYKRIMISLATIVAVGAIVAGATGAFYNDTETSENNIFTAGSVDLKVDHLKQTYNGETCTTEGGEYAQLWQIGDVESDPSANPVDELNFQAFGDFPSFPDPYVVENNSDSEFPWNSNAEEDYATDFDVQFTYNGSQPTQARLTFSWSPGASANETKQIEITSGNTNESATYTEQGTPETGWWEDMKRYEETFVFTVEPGVNTLNFKHTTGDGTLWDWLRVEVLEEGNGQIGSFSTGDECQLWKEKNLDGSETFFNFGDIKPGDSGTNVISLHSYSNDAYSCLLAENGQSDENTVHESEGDDTVEEGEVQDYIDFFAWIDENENNQYDSNDTDLGTSTLGNLGSLASLDSQSGYSLTGTTTKYIGLSWCAGNISVDQNGNVECDGSGMKNDAQSDSFSADLTAYAEQVRNNEDFVCESGESSDSIGCTEKADVMLVLDSSGSVGSDMGTLKTAAKDFVDTLSPTADGTNVGVVDFDSSANTIQSLTGDGNAAKTQINSLGAGGGTNLTAGIAEAQNQLDNFDRPDNEAPDFILIVNDGDANNPTSAETEATASKDAGTTIFAVGVGSLDPTFLQNSIVSTPSSDHYFHADNFEDIELQFNQILSCPADPQS